MAKVVGVERLTGTATPQSMSLAKGACDEVLIAVEGANIRWTDAPLDEDTDSSLWTLLVDGDRMPYRGDNKLFRFIAASGSPKVAFHKYQRNTF